MVKQHLKRLACPKTWPIERKSITFISRPNPGAQSLDHGLPLVVVLRDIIGVARNLKEVKYLLHNKDCLVDGSVCHDARRFVGLMGVVSFPKTKEYYRILINDKNKLCVVKINEKEVNVKVSKITGKTSLKGGKTQINTLDGRSILVDDASAYKVSDSLVLEIPNQTIKTHLKFEVGATILLDAGRHVGSIATIESIEGDVVMVKAKDNVFRTKKKYAIVIGKKEPVIAMA